MPLALALLLACSTPSPPEAEEQPARKAAQAAPSADLKPHMRGHLQAVDAVRTALVHGDLKAAQRANRGFLDHKVAFDLPGDWVSHVAAMGDAAVKLDKAADLPSAATHAAAMATACGACHHEVHAPVVLDRAPPADPDAHGPKEAFALQATWDAMVTRQGDVPGVEEAATALGACATCHAKVPAPKP